MAPQNSNIGENPTAPETAPFDRARPAVAHNPILPGFHPDPSICCWRDGFLLVVSSFNYWPGLPLFHSTDLSTWRPIGHALHRPAQLHLPMRDPSEGIYAPTIRSHGDRVFITTTNTSHGGNFVVDTDDPFGRWSDPIWLDRHGIDPGPLFTADGRCLLATTATGGGVAADPTVTIPAIMIGEIDIHTGQSLSVPQALTAGWCGQCPEGPRFVRRRNWWYLILAEGGTERGHMVTVGRSADPAGPYEPCPDNPVLTHRSQDDPVQSVGHADLVQAPDGSWWGVCLGTRPTGHPSCHVLGRETFLFPVTWVDDWPMFGDRGRVSQTVSLPWPGRDTSVVPTASGMPAQWQLLGTTASAWSHDPETGALSGPHCQPESDAPNMLLRRQTHHRFTFTARLELKCSGGPPPEAGLLVWMDHQHHYEILLRASSEGITATVHRTVGTLSAVTAQTTLTHGPVQVLIGSDGDDYILGLWNGPAISVLDRAATRYLSPEVAGGFTGVMVGLTVRSSETRTTFTDVAYQPVSPPTG